ncbi:hypothetical protein PIB30_024865 [Stylosanthes scabra]|uniref:Uncharacterized protein n=1 Tax=Stylosanthes scabra TaxID=79078 RepID=A0ABU6QBA4_9FABA|nr:hypothetical protein [Stylosanthes scabra]
MKIWLLRVIRIDSRDFRVDSNTSRDEGSLQRLQRIDSHPFRIDSGLFNELRLIFKERWWEGEMPDGGKVRSLSPVFLLVVWMNPSESLRDGRR